MFSFLFLLFTVFYLGTLIHLNLTRFEILSYSATSYSSSAFLWASNHLAFTNRNDYFSSDKGATKYFLYGFNGTVFESSFQCSNSPSISIY